MLLSRAALSHQAVRAGQGRNAALIQKKPALRTSASAEHGAVLPPEEPVRDMQPVVREAHEAAEALELCS